MHIANVSYVTWQQPNVLTTRSMTAKKNSTKPNAIRPKVHSKLPQLEPMVKLNQPNNTQKHQQTPNADRMCLPHSATYHRKVPSNHTPNPPNNHPNFHGFSLWENQAHTLTSLPNYIHNINKHSAPIECACHTLQHTTEKFHPTKYPK